VVCELLRACFWGIPKKTTLLASNQWLATQQLEELKGPRQLGSNYQ
jgi:hypothetical protein